MNKLSRIVSNILPENSTINVSNIDSATASWLSSTYSVAKQEMSNKVAEEEDLRTKLARHETLRMSLSQHVQDHRYDALTLTYLLTHLLLLTLAHSLTHPPIY